MDCIMDNWENMLTLTHTLDKVYLTGILHVQCLQIILHHDDNEMVYCTNKRVRSAMQNVSDYLHRYWLITSFSFSVLLINVLWCYLQVSLYKIWGVVFMVKYTEWYYSQVPALEWTDILNMIDCSGSALLHDIYALRPKAKWPPFSRQHF